MKVLAVYSICGIGGRDHLTLPYYVDAIRSLTSQSLLDGPGDKLKIAISGCLSSDPVQQALQNIFKDHLTYNWIEESYPLSITFNDTVDQCVKQFGTFDAYLYIDSGINFWDPCNRYDALEKLIEVHESGPYAITAAMPSNDDGKEWWGIQYQPNVDYIFPIGKTTNMHCQLFDEEWRKNFGRILPDIFADHTMESLYSIMSASINRKFIITQKVRLLHNHSMDGASIGSRNKHLHPDYMPSSEWNPGVLLFKTKKNMDQRYREGHQYGYGWEECKEYWPHDATKFDTNGYATDPELKKFFANEVFLKSEEFDYNLIKRMFIPGM